MTNTPYSPFIQFQINIVSPPPQKKSNFFLTIQHYNSIYLCNSINLRHFLHLLPVLTDKEAPITVDSILTDQ